MKTWLKENWFYTILLLLTGFTLFFLFRGEIELSEATSVMVFIVTAWAIAKQAFATEKIAEDQIRPIAHISMVKCKEDLGTFFYVRNLSKAPGRVWLDIELEIDGKKIETPEAKKILNNPRLSGDKHFPLDLVGYRTSSNHLIELMEYHSKKSIKATLNIFVAPTSKDKKPEILYDKKIYEYSPSNPHQWINEIGMPDVEFIELKAIK